MTKKFNIMSGKFSTRHAKIMLLSIFLTSCGVPTSSEFVQISEANIPFELNATTTTSTTTTIVVATDGDGSSSGSKNEQSAIVDESVDLYYIINNRLVATNIKIVSPATTTQVLSALVAGPPSGDTGSGLRSAIATSLQVTINVNKGIASIDANNFLLAGLSPIDQRLAIAQLVLTITSRPGIGQAQFSVNGTPIAIPRGRGDLSKPGETVSYDDYVSLLADRNS
ncbi:hypothetical protein EMGBS4_17540 [Acidimicrobiaceae bacterium]|nr:hypothetical protein EMGBS4_17540 [Acidimicrobiaceae bacterium]